MQHKITNKKINELGKNLQFIGKINQLYGKNYLILSKYMKLSL
jgi:hypothetical protein